MKIESPAFTQDDLDKFFDEQLDRERLHLARRLEEASARLAAIAPRITAHEGGEQWSDHEVLAHIAVLSKFYGVITSRVGSGKLTQVELLEAVQSRDLAGEQLSSLPPDQLLAMVQRDHQRTIAYLRGADAEAMQRRAVLYEGFSMSAAEIAQLPLCAHLEIHLDQLERTLRH